jgi:ribosomal protein L37AE/L43A
MSIMVNTCPCCGGSILRHVRHHEVYWFCLSCRQEVPVLSITGVSNTLSKLETRNQEVSPQTALRS